MASYKIALLPGDGIGPECMDATRLVLDRVISNSPGLDLTFTSHRAGAELYRETGDAMSLYMVQNPWDFDVLVMENQFGDILSDLGAGIVGGLGLGPSGEIGDEHALFQPSHGIALDIAGMNAANPLATILSAGMMLDWLGDKHGDQSCTDAAVALEAAVSTVLSDGDARTPDLGGNATTTEVAKAVSESLQTTVASG